MIKKSRLFPIEIKKLEALLKRLPPSSPKIAAIESDLAIRYAGYNGEQSIDYHLKPLFKKNYHILHDLRIPDGDDHFQIDTLLLSPNYILIIEVKNFQGTLFFDLQLNQLIRRKNNAEEAYPCPILQIKRLTEKLANWLSKHKFPEVPLESQVVISNPKTLIKTDPYNMSFIQKKVTHSANLVEKMKTFENKHVAEKMNQRDLKRVTKLLIKQHNPRNPDVLQRYQIKKENLKQGVFCTECAEFSMKRERRSWICAKCSIKAKDAHISALQDYALLIKPTITNSQCREFLGIASSSTAKKLLLGMNLSYKGTTKGREYELPSVEESI